MPDFSSNQWMASTGAGYTIENSLRFDNDGNDASADAGYLTKTFASAGNRVEWTYSLWVKLGAPYPDGNFGTLFSAKNPDLDMWRINGLSVVPGSMNVNTTNGTDVYLITDRVFRDSSAWYHLVMAMDRAESGSAKCKLYVNGVLLTDFSTQALYSGTGNGVTNDDCEHAIGRRIDNDSAYFDGYMADIHFIDGQQLAPTAFANEDSNGQWVPKAYSTSASGVYGPNGFRLDFADGTSTTTLGYDVSGEDNHWSLNNMATTDQTSDSPSAGKNYCTWNPLHIATTGALTDGNLVTAGAAVGNFDAMAFDSYWEITLTGTVSIGAISESGTASTASLGSGTHGIRLTAAGDLDYTSNGSAWADIATVSGTHFPYVAGAATLNCGQSDFTYTPPTGYKALNSGNLTASAITTPTDHFGILLWAGTDVDGEDKTGLDFTPNLVWIKNRTNDYSHILGTTGNDDLFLASNSDGAYESPDDSKFQNTIPGGVRVGDHNDVNDGSGTPDNYVAWCWKESATAGFDIVTWEGDDELGSGATQEVSYSIGGAADMIIAKNTSNIGDWIVYHKDLPTPAANALKLNSTDEGGLGYESWDETLPAASTFRVGSAIGYGALNTFEDNYIAFCFRSVDGFSKAGVYDGNDEEYDGTYVNTGFAPAWVMVKGIEYQERWVIMDTKRDTYEGNPFKQGLYPDANTVEGTGDAFQKDFLSNGFKARGTDGEQNDDASYIFLAFAEQQFKYGNAK